MGTNLLRDTTPIAMINMTSRHAVWGAPPRLLAARSWVETCTPAALHLPAALLKAENRIFPIHRVCGDYNSECAKLQAFFLLCRPARKL